MTQYQALIIGFGKAGKTLAATLAKTGWRVAIIEQSASMFGGTCINIGCIPDDNLTNNVRPHFQVTVPTDVNEVRLSIDGGKTWVTAALKA
ncbi:hypothetical protein MJI95_13415, partial [Salmonella enterica subsp. enterica serovar Kentucky]|nr:hypothetical protein [Salmonella enterica subsp. enterica serovar Kentucky]